MTIWYQNLLTIIFCRIELLSSRVPDVNPESSQCPTARTCIVCDRALEGLCLCGTTATHLCITIMGFDSTGMAYYGTCYLHRLSSVRQTLQHCMCWALHWFYAKHIFLWLKIVVLCRTTGLSLPVHRLYWITSVASAQVSATHSTILQQYIIPFFVSILFSANSLKFN